MPLQLTWTDNPEPADSPDFLSALDIQPPLPENSHIFIEGDNYPVLKKLSSQFTGKINLIYIDPPYNTGNDFTYNDNFLVRDGRGEADRHSAD